MRPTRDVVMLLARFSREDLDRLAASRAGEDPWRGWMLEQILHLGQRVVAQQEVCEAHGEGPALQSRTPPG